MAEFENGYCTGCGVRARRWGHRPYCWRKVTMMLNVNPTYEVCQKLLREMGKHWRVRSLFLVHRKHMYHQYGDAGGASTGALHDAITKANLGRRDK